DITVFFRRGALQGNGPVQVSTDTNTQIRVLLLKTAEEILTRERERKARTTLLMAIPEDHLAKFHKMTDAKEMWKAIKSRFGGNDESKKMQKYLLKQQFESFSVSNSEGLHKGYDRFQSLLSQLETHGVGVSTKDANQKFLRSKENQDSRRKDAGNTGYKPRDNEKRPAKQDEHKAMVTIDGEGVGWIGHAVDKTKDYALMAFSSSNSGSDTKEIISRSGKEKEELKTQLENFQSSSKGLSKLLTSQMSAKDKSGLGYGSQIHDKVLSYENEVFASVFDSRSSDVEDSPVNNRFVKVKEMHAVPPPMTGNYMPSKSDFRINESKFTYGPKKSTTSESDAKNSDLDSCDSSSSEETLGTVP
nr:ribonuclease H-like domain-containing protein [Tanacetum cinerariifolium]